MEIIKILNLEKTADISLDEQSSLNARGSFIELIYGTNNSGI